MELPDIFKEENQRERISQISSKTDYLDAKAKIYKNMSNDLDKFYLRNIGHQIFLVNVQEILKNAYYHGNTKNQGIEFGYFYSPKNVVIGCNDGGHYFKDSRIKEIWENKEPIMSSDSIFNEDGRQVSGYNIGMDFIYNYYNDIFIDTNQGAFFGRINIK